MPPAFRVGDRAFNPADSHGCPACPHPVQGPATSGSPNVLVNGRAQMRIGDPGLHGACCGPNTWKCVEGSSTVRVNGIAPARLGDGTSHCGGSGKAVAGSPDVIIGDQEPGPPPVPETSPQKPIVPRLVECLPGSGKVYVNLPDDEAQLHGRTFTVKAKVEPPQAGLTVNFSLREILGNAREDLEPGSETELGQVSAVTDGAGLATTDLTVSRNAGDRVMATAALQGDGSAVANAQGGAETGAVDSGLLEVWRKLEFDVIEMEKPPETTWQKWFPKRWSLEDDLPRAIEGFKEVFVDFVDSGKRYAGEFVGMLRVEEALEWCEAACPPGPPGGDVPRIHLVVVPSLCVSERIWGARGGGRRRTASVVGDLEGGVYTFELPTAPYARPDGTLDDLQVGKDVWIRDPNTGFGAPAIDEPQVLDVKLKGPLGSKEVTLDFSNGGFPGSLGPQPIEGLEMVIHYYEIDELAGYCLEGGQYVIMSEALDGEVLLHEVGHALGLARPADTHDGINHCAETHCVMFYADQPGSSQSFHGGMNPSKGSCAHWIRRLDMSTDHLYQRWWADAGWYSASWENTTCPTCGG